MEERKGATEEPDTNPEKIAGDPPHSESSRSHNHFLNSILSQMRRPAVLNSIGASMALLAAAAIFRRSAPQASVSEILASRAGKLTLLRLRADPITVAAFLKILGDEIEQAIED